jgi:hypothetical protein
MFKIEYHTLCINDINCCTNGRTNIYMTQHITLSVQQQTRHRSDNVFGLARLPVNATPHDFPFYDNTRHNTPFDFVRQDRQYGIIIYLEVLKCASFEIKSVTHTITNGKFSYTISYHSHIININLWRDNRVASTNSDLLVYDTAE